MSIISKGPDDEDSQRVARLFGLFKAPEPAILYDGTPSDIKAAKSVERFYLRIEEMNSSMEQVGKGRYARETLESAARRTIQFRLKRLDSFYITTNEGEKLAYCYQKDLSNWVLVVSSDKAMEEFLEQVTAELSQSGAGLALLRIREVDPAVPLAVSMIPKFPFENYEDLVSAVNSGRYRIGRFSFVQDRTILRIISPPLERLYLGAVLLTFLVPLASLILAFTVSNWFWLGLLYFFCGCRITTNFWIRSILNAAMCSESAFCLLFYTSKVHVIDVATSAEYEWHKITPT